MIRMGMYYCDISKEWGVDRTALSNWINADEDRRARAREARHETGQLWDIAALKAIEKLGPEATSGDIARAREEASHMRWRAKAMSRDYADRSHATIEATVKKAPPVSEAAMIEEIAELSQALGLDYQLVKLVDEDEAEDGT